MHKRTIVNLLFALGWVPMLFACGADSVPREDQAQDQVQDQDRVQNQDQVQDQDRIEGQGLDLPTFESAMQLSSSPWHQYFMDVYGNIPTSPSEYPLDLDEWWIFYNEYLSTIGKIHCEDFGGANCPIPPSAEGQAICSLSGGDHDLPDVVYIYHAPPYSPLPGNTWVEFTHTADHEAQQAEKVGSWMYYVPGSSYYFYLGKTRSFKDHADAVQYFLDETCFDTECVDYFPALFEAAASQGYDSIQFLDHADMTCGQNTAVEIVDVAGSGMYACGDENPDQPAWNARYRTGWNASLPCDCSNAASEFFNCSGS